MLDVFKNMGLALFGRGVKTSKSAMSHLFP